MNRTKSILLTVAALPLFGLAIAGTAMLTASQPASAQRGGRCNPPRPNLDYNSWYRDCEGVLQARFRDSNAYGLPYSEFVRMIWQMYEVQYHPERHPGLVGSPCSPEGSGYVNQSGHRQICRGGRWQVMGQ